MRRSKRSAIAPPNSDMATSGMSSTAPRRPVRKAEPRLEVDLERQRDEHRLRAQAGDELAER